MKNPVGTHRTIADGALLSALREFDGKLRARFGDDYVRLILFGSRARGDHEPDSDADVAVVMRGPIGKRWPLECQFIEESWPILLETGLYIQSWAFEEAELADPDKSWNPSLIRNILAEGIPEQAGDAVRRVADADRQHPRERGLAMAVPEFLAKADTAIASAKRDLAAGDAEGAANRLYYAMFHAAGAALQSIGQRDYGKHRTIIARFSRHFCKDGPLSSDLGRAINRAQELKVRGDYGSAMLDMAEVARLVAKAEEFLAAVKSVISRTPG